MVYLLLSITANAQLPHNSSGKIYFGEEIKIDSTDADALYIRAKTWVLENFANARQVIQKDEASAHRILLRASGECYAPHSFGDTIENVNNSYTLEIETNNDGYKYSVTEFKTTDKWKGEQPSEDVSGGKKQMLLNEQTIKELVATLTTSLKLAMDKRVVVGME
jgi:hypothetical protein